MFFVFSKVLWWFADPITLLLVCALLGLLAIRRVPRIGRALGLAGVGCGSSPSTSSDKIGSDKMGSDKMGGDKMGTDKMGTDKMGDDKMGADKMGDDKKDKK